MVFYLIGTNLINGNEQYTWTQIKNQVLSGTLSVSGDGSIIKIQKDQFRVGNLDQLMYINDQITKIDTQVESLLKKIERQYHDIDEEAASTPFKVKTRDGANSTLEKYLKEFQWDDSKFARNQPLQALLKEIQNRIFRVENELKSKTQQLQDNKNLQNQNANKDGSLVTKDLCDVLKEPLVNSKEFVNTQYIQTIVLIVPQSQIPLLTQNYEIISENIIAGSLHYYPYFDKENQHIFTVKILKTPLNKKSNQNPLESLIKNMRDQLKIVARVFDFIPGQSEQRDVLRHELGSKTQVLTKTLRQSCEQSFSEIYIIYLHLKNLKFIVELVMRFGNNNKQFLCLIQPSNGKEKKIQQNLLKLFSDNTQIGIFKSLGMYGTKEELEDTEDFFPFVYVPINIH